MKFKNQFKPLDEEDVEYLVGAVYRGGQGVEAKFGAGGW